jgi:hypothetical protein
MLSPHTTQTNFKTVLQGTLFYKKLASLCSPCTVRSYLVSILIDSLTKTPSKKLTTQLQINVSIPTVLTEHVQPAIPVLTLVVVNMTHLSQSVDCSLTPDNRGAYVFVRTVDGKVVVASLSQLCFYGHTATTSVNEDFCTPSKYTKLTSVNVEWVLHFLEQP